MISQQGFRTKFKSRQHGAVAIIVAICLVVLIGMIGLVVDVGHMFIIKTELQNAADSCALAAARELDGTADGLARAENAGITVGQRNNVDLQNESVSILPSDVTFSDNLSPNSNYVSRSGGAAASSDYVMCTLRRPGIVMWFMQALGFGNQAVSARAVATLQPSQTTCAVPVGVCTQGLAPSFGLVAGKWYSGKFGSGAGESMTGSYNWIDFSPPNGGANELKDLLTGAGQCDLPPVGTLVGEQGQVTGLSSAWNSRFGVYKNGGYSVTDAPPDFTGLAYTNATWPHADATTPQNAYSGTPDSGSTQNYLSAQNARVPYQSSNPAGLQNSFNPSTVPEHTQFGANRRIAVAPIVDCAALESSNPQAVSVLGYACVLMLNPIEGPNDVFLEIQGLANDPSSPCASYGIPGGAGAAGPLVAVLVQ